MNEINIYKWVGLLLFASTRNFSCQHYLTLLFPILLLHEPCSPPVIPLVTHPVLFTASSLLHS